MPLSTRLRQAATVAISAAGILTVIAGVAAARTLNASDEAHLHLIHASGSQLIEEGRATGAIPGTVKASFTVEATVAGTFTIYTRGGSITGRGSGTLRGTGTYASFGGSLTVTGGTGRYKHAHGSGGLYGTVNRRTEALVVQITGHLSY